MKYIFFFITIIITLHRVYMIWQGFQKKYKENFMDNNKNIDYEDVPEKKQK